MHNLNVVSSGPGRLGFWVSRVIGMAPHFQRLLRRCGTPSTPLRTGPAIVADESCPLLSQPTQRPRPRKYLSER